jgi:hypothetical protein
MPGASATHSTVELANTAHALKNIFGGALLARLGEEATDRVRRAQSIASAIRRLLASSSRAGKAEL